MRRRFASLFSVLVVAAFVLPPYFAFAQGNSTERRYQRSKTEVEKALQQIHSSLAGRLPVLDGFVDTDQPLSSYSRGYYQCSVQVTPASAGGALVRVTAKITAWDAGSTSSQAGYRALPSNGRIEGDLLDRLNELLGGNASVRNSNSTSAPTREIESSPTMSPGASRGQAETPSSPAAQNGDAANPPGNRLTLPSSSPRFSASARSEVSPSTSANPALAALANEDLASLQKRREGAEQRQKDLNTDVMNLEEIQRAQAHPLDLAVVKRAGTPVLSKPESSAQALFRAEVGDEFQVIEKEENWVHVQISGESRGWIRRSELDLPGIGELPRAGESIKETESPEFRVSREETKAFPGNWEPLRGKTVRIVWVEPASTSPTSTAEAKRRFAKSLFLKAYREIASATPPDAGVVIVFDSADGGQISATLTTLKEWQAGTLPEATFWKQCAVDPPELLQDASKAAGGNF